MPRVLVTEPVHPAALELLREGGCTVDYAPDLSPAALPGLEVAAEAVLVRLRPVRRAWSRLRLVAKHGVGVDNIDLAAMTEAGVRVMNTPGANAGAVAEHALMMMLALARDLDALRGADLAIPVPGLGGRRLTVVGLGATGRRMAELGLALGMRVTAVVRTPPASVPDGLGVATELRDLLPETDVLSLHCPLTEATRHLVGAAELGALPRGAIVVNCARGGLIDEAALVAALTEGRLGGAGLDVTEIEPLPADHPLRSAPRTILTPHAAAMSEGAFRAMGLEAARNVVDFFAGRPRADRIVV